MKFYKANCRIHTYTSSLLICQSLIHQFCENYRKGSADGKCWGVCPGKNLEILKVKFYVCPKDATQPMWLTSCRWWALFLVTWETLAANLPTLGEGEGIKQWGTRWWWSRFSGWERTDLMIVFMGARWRPIDYGHGHCNDQLLERNKWQSWVIILNKMSTIRLILIRFKSFPTDSSLHVFIN